VAVEFGLENFLFALLLAQNTAGKEANKVNKSGQLIDLKMSYEKDARSDGFVEADGELDEHYGVEHKHGNHRFQVAQLDSLKNFKIEVSAESFCRKSVLSVFTVKLFSLQPFDDFF
jgi:hypothetical protein